MMFLPTIITIGLINWPYAFFYKALTFTSSSILTMRVMNKTVEPESPETYLREMIHTHSQLKDLFQVESTTTLDYRLDYVKQYPDVEKFPEFNNNVYRFMNNDGNFQEGEYTFGDVESGAMMRVTFKTMPIRRKFKLLLGEPTFLYSVKAELNHNG